MKKIAFLTLFTLTVLAACQRPDGTVIYLINPLDEARNDAGLTLTREEISGITTLPESDSLFPLLLKKDGTPLPCQVDDMDNDQSWEELFVMTDYRESERKEVYLVFRDQGEYPEYTPRTNIRFADKKNNHRELTSAIRLKHAVNTITAEFFQMEGIAFENEHVGFRNYYDQRNGMDIFGKTTEEMVLDQVGYKNYPDYHTFNPEWGMDVLKVGSSLGAGSIAAIYNDTLFRIGDNGPGTCNVLTEGPLRSIFQFDFIDWSMNGTLINVQHKVTIQAGTHYYDNRVMYEGIEENIDIATGIVNKKSDQLYEADPGNGYVAYYTHAPQSEDGSILGMGIMLPENDFAGTFATPDSGRGITETYAVNMSAVPAEPVSYRFYSVWEQQDSTWRDPDAFEALLTKDARLAAHPVRWEKK